MAHTKKKKVNFKVTLTTISIYVAASYEDEQRVVQQHIHHAYWLMGSG